jgi:hypothetical protein
MASRPDDALRHGSDTVLKALDRLTALEAEKRRLEPDDPRILEVADEVAGLAAELLEVAKDQSHITETAHVMATTGEPEAPSGPIDESPRAPHDILEEWRAAERALTVAPPGSPEAAEAHVRARELRAEYQRAYQASQRGTRES